MSLTHLGKFPNMFKTSRAKLFTPAQDPTITFGSGSLPHLNSAHEVNKIVRKFASDVIKNTFAGEMSREQFVSWIEERIKALSRLFLGEFTMEAAQYQRGIWNTPENLGRFLVENLTPQASNTESVERLFNKLGTDVMQIVKNSQLTEEVSKKKLDLVCAQARDLLLGLGVQSLQ